MTETIKLKSPIDGSIYAERPVADDKAINAAVERARAAQVDWAQTSIATRGKYMLAMLEALTAMADEIVPEIAWQMGRPVRYGGEFGGVKERTQYMVEIAEKALAPVMASNPKDGFRRYVKKDPLGVVMVIAPWNYPYLTAVNTIVPALMAGSTVILKHAAQTLLVGERFAQAFEKAGLPKGVFQNLVMNHAQTEKLLGSGKIDHANFTGSVAGGARHREGSRRHLHDARPRTRRQGPGLCRCRTPRWITRSPIWSRARSSTPASAAAASSASMFTRRSTTSSSKASSPRRRITRSATRWNRRPPWGRWRRRASPTSSGSRRPRRCARAPRLT